MKTTRALILGSMIWVGYGLVSAAANEPVNAQLIEACKRGDLQSVKSLVSRGANFNSESLSGWTPLMHAGYEGQLNVVKWLIENKADPNHRSSYDKYTALHWSASQNRVEVVMYLISKGADVKKADVGMPLLLLAHGRDPRIAEEFIKRGANVNGCDGSGKCVLTCASEWAGLDIVPLLVSTGADVNIRGSGFTKFGITRKDFTPLMLASVRGNLELVKFLVSKGADINLKDGEGKSALVYSRDYGDESSGDGVYNYLRSLGAKQ